MALSNQVAAEAALACLVRDQMAQEELEARQPITNQEAPGGQDLEVAQEAAVGVDRTAAWVAPALRAQEDRMAEPPHLVLAVPVVFTAAVLVARFTTPVRTVAMAPFALFGDLDAISHQQIRGTCDGAFYSDSGWAVL